MTLSPSCLSAQKPETVAKVCRGLLEDGQPVLSLLMLASRNGPRLPWDRPMYLRFVSLISTLGYCSRACGLKCSFYPPVGLGKPGLVRPWARAAGSERVRRVVPRYVFGSDIELTDGGRAVAEEQRECHKRHLLGHHGSGGSCGRLGDRRRGMLRWPMLNPAQCACCAHRNRASLGPEVWCGGRT